LERSFAAALFIIQSLLIEKLVRGVQIKGIAAAFAPVGLAVVGFESLIVAANSVVDIVAWLSLAIVATELQLSEIGDASALVLLAVIELEFPVAAIGIPKGQIIAIP
jgi:hypothetical protein